MKQKGIIPFLGIGIGGIILLILIILGLFLITQTIKFTNTGILLVVGFLILYLATKTTDTSFQKQLTFISLILIGGSLLIGSFFAIIGTPFFTQNFTQTFTPSCAYAACYDPIKLTMEGTYAAGIISSTYFNETNINPQEPTQDFDVRAVSCTAKITSLPNCNTTSGQIVSQLQTSDGTWIDYYASGFTESQESCGGQSRSPIQITKVYKVPNENQYVYMNTGGESLDLSEGQQFIANKVRCRVDFSWQTARYSNTVALSNGLLAVYGTTHEPTCSDGIKNQDETEVDYGGVCGTGTTTPDVCGDSVCTGNETINSCPVDCADSNPENNDPETCSTGYHYELVDGQQQCVADLNQNQLGFWIVLIAGSIGTIISLWYIFLRKK